MARFAFAKPQPGNLLDDLRKARDRELNRQWRKRHTVWTLVRNHWRYIHTCRGDDHTTYRRGFGRGKRMPFERAWNPRRGGSFERAEQDILHDIGERPSKHHQLGILVHKKGFVRGNLLWQDRSTNNRAQLHKIVAQQTLRIRELEQHVAQLEQKLKACRKKFRQRKLSRRKKN